MLEDGDDIRTVQELLGHSGVSTTIDVLTRAEPRRAWRSESVRPALTAERRVGRESLRLTAPGSLHTFHSPIDSRHGSWRVGPLGCSPAFTAVRRSKPRRLRPTTVSPWYPRVRQVSHFSGGSTRVSRNGIPTLAARGGAAIAGRWCIALPSIRFTSGELRRFPARFLFRRWLRRGADLARFLRPKPAKAGHWDGWRLDFRGLSRKTARAAARDGCERGLAVHSVRS